MVPNFHESGAQVVEVSGMPYFLESDTMVVVVFRVPDILKSSPTTGSRECVHWREVGVKMRTMVESWVRCCSIGW